MPASGCAGQNACGNSRLAGFGPAGWARLFGLKGNMTAEQKLPVEIQDALSKGLLNRIPLTFLPFVNQQLNQWDYLFPNERQSVERLLIYVASLSPAQSA